MLCPYGHHMTSLRYASWNYRTSHAAGGSFYGAVVVRFVILECGKGVPDFYWTMSQDIPLSFSCFPFFLGPIIIPLVTLRGIFPFCMLFSFDVVLGGKEKKKTTICEKTRGE